MPSIEKPPVLELKQLSSPLKYVYLGHNETLPVIISSYLTPLQEENLIVTWKRHKKAIRWQIVDIKGISPTLCMHKILLEDNSKNSIEGQRRLNPIMKEVVKKEIIKWPLPTIKEIIKKISNLLAKVNGQRVKHYWGEPLERMNVTTTL